MRACARRLVGGGVWAAAELHFGGEPTEVARYRKRFTGV
jgi:hypothetical protein